MNSNQLLNSQLTPRNKTTPLIFLVVSFLGFLDATYLTVSHFLGTGLNCSILGECELVTTSAYSVILGVPVALLGLIYYVFIFLSTIFYFDSKPGKKEVILRFISKITIIGFLASLWFLYLQIFVIDALCMYCLISLITSTILFITGLYVLKKQKK